MDDFLSLCRPGGGPHRPEGDAAAAAGNGEPRWAGARLLPLPILRAGRLHATGAEEVAASSAGHRRPHGRSAVRPPGRVRAPAGHPQDYSGRVKRQAAPRLPAPDRFRVLTAAPGVTTK
ncbi:hypothetical protein GCM10010327_42200 [Streptomyces nitrosporeus]|nr:hypothetical protein GCM10010327_42200 [Streptomyces nitrosporeus]